jgi:hypothetical protein
VRGFRRVRAVDRDDVKNLCMPFDLPLPDGFRE